MITLFFMIAASAAMQAGEIELPDHNIRVGDIASAPGYEDQVIGVLPHRAAEVELDETTARQLLRNRFPSLRYVLRFDGKVRLSAREAPQTDDRNCLAAAADLPAGATITPSNTVKADCPARHSRAPIGFDPASRVSFARAFIPAGTPLGPLRFGAADFVPEGKVMSLRFAAGPVIVERQVVSLQPGVPGERVFVKTEDGEVITARLVRGQDGATQ